MKYTAKKKIMNNYIIYKNVSFVYEVEANSEGEAKKIAQADTKLKNFSLSWDLITFPSILPKYLTSSLRSFVGILS